MVQRSFIQVAYSSELLALLCSFQFSSSVGSTSNPVHFKSAELGSSLHRRSLNPQPTSANNSVPSVSNAPINPNKASTLASTLPSSVGSQDLKTTAAPANVAPHNNTACVQPPLTNSTWIQLGIDNYLANLPNGTSLSLQHYAASVGASDFICGIGEKCQAGQLCSPVQSPGWEVLLAAQEWNNFQNKFYEAVGTAIQMVTSISASLVVDMYPPEHTGDLWSLFNSFNLAAGITSAVVGVFIFLVGSAAVVASPFAILSLTAIGITAGVTGSIGMKQAVKHRGEDAFDKFSVYAFYLSEWQKHAQKSISNSTRSVIAAGVSSPAGISGVLKNGVFFRERPTVNEADLVADLKNTTTVRILTDVLRNQGAFVTIASDKCTSKGPGGAWKGDDVLSYCSPNGTMFNIIQSGKKKVHNRWYNANLIARKYGITVKYLTEQSYFCQLNHGTANFDPYKSGAFPSDMSAECISNLPVCDFRNPEVAESKKEKNTMYACRNVAKLPI